MSDRPILFSGPMVRALIAGTKMQTRRVLKGSALAAREPQWEAKKGDDGVWRLLANTAEVSGSIVPDIRIETGDRLWVREAWTLHDRAGDVGTVAYQATIKSHGWTETIEQFPRELTLSTRVQPVQQGWRPSIHMPRWASRLTLTVTDVRVERLQDISETDAWAEGCAKGAPDDLGGFFPAEEPDPSGIGYRGWDNASHWYADLWEHINGDGAWDLNPWVTAYTFTVERGNIDKLARAA